MNKHAAKTKRVAKKSGNKRTAIRVRTRASSVAKTKGQMPSRLEIPADSDQVLGKFHGEALWACTATSDGLDAWAGFGLVTRCVIQSGVMTFHAECGGYAYDVVLTRIAGAPNGFRGEWTCADQIGSVAARLLKDNNGYLMLGKWDENGPHKFFVELIPD
jgi:hypothetical protein